MPVNDTLLAMLFETEKAKMPSMSHCNHSLNDVWGDQRTPDATEVTLEEAKVLVEEKPAERYAACSFCGVTTVEEVESV